MPRRVPVALLLEFYRVFFTGLNATINHHTRAWPAIVVAVKTKPLMANSGMKYVRMDAVGMLAVLLGTWELLLSTVGKLKKANPALPIEIRRSTWVNQACSNSSLI